MSFQGPRNRRARRGETAPGNLTSTKYDLPGLLGLLTNPKVFAVAALIFAAGLLLSVLVGGLVRPPAPASGVGTDVFGRPVKVPKGPIQQANEAPDAPPDEDTAPASANATTGSTPVPVKRYQSAPPLMLDGTKRYLATIETAKGEIAIELYPDEAPLAVNAFLFLAQDGYYNGTPFMQLVKNPDGSRFTIQAGDPTRTGLGTPGFSVKKEQTTKPFSRGAVGMGGSVENSNGGQFFISMGDYPALNGKYTIFGRVLSGLDLLERVSLLDLTKGGPRSSSGDEIRGVTISEQ